MQTLEALEIEPEIREALEAYAVVVKTPVNMLVREALRDYVECVVVSRLEVASSVRKDNVLTFPLQ